VTDGRDERHERQQAQTLFLKAVRLVHMRRWRTAARALSECAALRGDDADLMLLRSRCYMELGRHLDALPLLEQAVDRLSSRDMRRHQLANALADLGHCFRNAARGMDSAPRRLQREKALAAYRAAARMEPNDRDLRDSVRQLESALTPHDAPPPAPTGPDDPPSKAELS